MTYNNLNVFLAVFLAVWGYLSVVQLHEIANELKMLRENLQTLSNQFAHYIKFGHK